MKTTTKKILKLKTTRKDWEAAYSRAKKKYTGQYLLDIPAKKGKVSFSYDNDINQTVIVYMN